MWHLSSSSETALCCLRSTVSPIPQEHWQPSGLIMSPFWLLLQAPVLSPQPQCLVQQSRLRRKAFLLPSEITCLRRYRTMHQCQQVITQWFTSVLARPCLQAVVLLQHSRRRSQTISRNISRIMHRFLLARIPSYTLRVQHLPSSRPSLQKLSRLHHLLFYLFLPLCPVLE